MLQEKGIARRTRGDPNSINALAVIDARIKSVRDTFTRILGSDGVRGHARTSVQLGAARGVELDVLGVGGVIVFIVSARGNQRRVDARKPVARQRVVAA